MIGLGSLRYWPFGGYIVTLGFYLQTETQNQAIIP